MENTANLTNIFTRYNFKSPHSFIPIQIQHVMLDSLEVFISEHFKYPKGGGWDLDSLRADLFFQYDVMETPTIDLQSPNIVEIISQEIIQRYQPNLSTSEDHETIQKISQVIYEMEIARLGL